MKVKSLQWTYQIKYRVYIKLCQGMPSNTANPRNGTSTNRCSRYNTSIAGANYQNTSNSHKQNKEDNPAHKLDPEKLETKLTNTYKQPTMK
jgi:hypothetical protein